MPEIMMDIKVRIIIFFSYNSLGREDMKTRLLNGPQQPEASLADTEQEMWSWRVGSEKLMWSCDPQVKRNCKISASFAKGKNLSKKSDYKISPLQPRVLARNLFSTRSCEREKAPMRNQESQSRVEQEPSVQKYTMHMMEENINIEIGPGPRYPPCGLL